jgi:hypothetical protein
VSKDQVSGNAPKSSIAMHPDGDSRRALIALEG